MKKYFIFSTIVIVIIAGLFIIKSLERPTVKVNENIGWNTVVNNEYGFQFKYPSDFFDVNQEPKILVGDCNYGVFPNACPSINDLVINNESAGGGDIGVIKSNVILPNYWKKPNGEKFTINSIPYCLYQTVDAATGHIYNSYYYVTVKNKKCLVANFVTNTANCDFYLPLENGNTEQAKGYNACIVTNQNQPKVLSQILSTFEFIKQ